MIPNLPPESLLNVLVLTADDPFRQRIFLAINRTIDLQLPGVHAALIKEPTRPPDEASVF